MNKEKQYYEITDAFLALKDIDDDEIEGMLRADKASRDARIHEGKAFSIQGSKDLEAARKFIDEDASDEDEIEVIDVDADTVDHIKKNTEYVGQGILCCNRCKANRFIDMDLLVASEVDEEVFNIDDECPHCHDAGSGYSLLGQVGKVQKTVEQPAEADVAVANDTVDSDEATFDNDLEEVEQEVVEEPVEEEPEVETVEEPKEKDGMETDTSEDELDDLDLPALGDEVDVDDVDEDEEEVKESLNEDVQLNALAEEAWMMNRVISSMNNEDAYFGSWLYLWPDGETREECAYDFGDQESFDELEAKFLKTYKHYHADGLYAAAPEVVEYAHKIDSKLGLAKIENLEPVKPHVREAFECAVAGDIFNAITSPEKVDKIIILDISDEESEPRTVFKGSREDLPMNVIGSPCKSFDVADGYLSCNIDSDVENTNRPLCKALECFNDDKTDKVLVWDQAKGEEVFSGTKEDACNKFGNCEFISFETPAVIRINIKNPGILSCDELEDSEPETDVNKLIKKIIDANNMSQYKIDKPATNEYWIRACLEENDDVELIYESFVKPTGDAALIREFKAVTGYNNALEAAYEAGYAAAAVNEAVDLDQVKAAVEAEETAAKADVDKDSKNDKDDSVTEGIDIAAKFKVGDELEYTGVMTGLHVNLEVTKVTDDYLVADEIWIAEDAGKTCRSPRKFEIEKDDAGNDCIVVWEYHGEVGRVYPPAAAMNESKITDTIKKVATRLGADAATIVRCFAELLPGEKAYDLMTYVEDKAVLKALLNGNETVLNTLTKEDIEELTQDIAEYEAAKAKSKKESVRCFKSRKELAEAVQECKNNSRPYTIRRSTTEGYRYDLVEEADGAEVINKLKGASDYEAFVKILNSDGKSKAFLDYLSQHYELGDDSIKTIKKSGASEGTVKCSQLVPTQQNISLSKSLGMINKGGWSEKIINTPLDAFNDPTITYAGKYIIDGHHRWSKAYALNGGDCEIKVLNFPAISGVTWQDMLKATQLAIIANNPGASLVNEVGNDNMLTSSDDEIKKFVTDNICDAVLAAMKAKGRGDDKEAVAETVAQNVAEMRATSQPVSGAAPRSVMPQTDQAEGSLDDMKTAVIDLTEETALIPSGSGEIEVVDDIPQELPVEYTPEQRALMDQIHRVALDISQSISTHYNIEADPEIIVADIIRDLQLISGDVSVHSLGNSAADLATKEMFNSYEAFYEFIDSFVTAMTGREFVTTPDMKIKQAIKMLHGPNFSTQAIDKAIGSTAFIKAARGGNVPYIAPADIPRLEEAYDRMGDMLVEESFLFNKKVENLEAEVCESCGKAPCECGIDEVLEELLSHSMDVDTDAFDEEMNSYFNDTYDDTVVYTTTGGEIDSDGTIMLEGLIQYEDMIKPVTFTLTPENKITEEVEDRDQAFENIMSETFKVTNNISEEVFEFKFSK